MNPDWSVVTTIYRSEQYLEEFVSQCLQVFSEWETTSFELVFVLDGITDNSLEWLLKKKEEVPQIVVVELSRNFGHHYALSAGMNQAQGKWIFLIDCDLETSPRILKQFQEEQKETQADVVYGIQKERKGSWVKSRLGSLFWKLFNFFSDVRVPTNVMTERLMSRHYLDQLNSLGDKNLFLGGMMYWVGFHQVGVELDKNSRKQSTYSLVKRMDLMVQAISSFSAKPLFFLFYLGLLISLISLSYMGYLFISKVLYPDQILSGFTTLAAILLFSTGIVVLSLGILGLYLSKVFIQTQDRPLYIVKQIVK